MVGLLLEKSNYSYYLLIFDDNCYDNINEIQKHIESKKIYLDHVTKIAPGLELIDFDWRRVGDKVFHTSKPEYCNSVRPKYKKIEIDIINHNNPLKVF